MASLSLELIRWARNPKNPPGDSARAYFLARLTRCQCLNLGKTELNHELIDEVDQSVLKRTLILPLSRDGAEVTVAMANPLKFEFIQDFELATGWSIVKKYVASREGIQRALTSPVSVGKDADVKQSILSELELESREVASELRLVNENSAPIIRLANWIILEAERASASDVHIEPEESRVIIRFRIDGVCQVFEDLPKSVHLPLVNRIKIMSDMNIAEKRLPHDGRLNFIKFQSGREVDLRVSIVPTVLGESIVMRLLQKNSSMIPLPQLGFSKDVLTRYEAILAAPHGMILHCGPTGSGKSMSMFAALQTLNSPDVKIVTAENPVEYTLPGLTQVEVNVAVGLTFSRALRAFLRQDPDIILIGEMRDRETAEIGVQAALTGHKLFSTLHTNDACSTVVRLIELKVDPFLIADATLGICAQRLIRRLCRCKIVTVPDLQENMFIESVLGRTLDSLATEKGCKRCKNSGFKGRIGIYELLVMNSKLREAINRGELGDQLKAIARKSGMKTLFEEGLARVEEHAVGLATVRKQLPRDLDLC
ncbi:MAG: GspE/PulE family protein [Planctomycetota bacterium]|nr:GspE/PulE family protein [Planctomycetota bacterium]